MWMELNSLINLSGNGHETVSPGMAIILVVGSVLGVIVVLIVLSKLNSLMDD
jgi:hypothetical protein